MDSIRALNGFSDGLGVEEVCQWSRWAPHQFWAESGSDSAFVCDFLGCL